MNFIVMVLALLLPTATVESVVSFLGKLAEQLAVAEAKQADRSEALRSQAKQLLAQADAADAEGERFSRVRGKLTDLVA
ncbi:hypothetical protein AV944_00480 [Sphingomonas sp. LK11]|uniref:hypothetical protein n=1 Tax=Sphingomonas sp. LK11 TaxID=1390395 RepID=UPI000972A0F1|nr:hypothetical protein [Sphingomonas sp. LK11]APX64574.1 hypothetical protein AV944_00480 [Sphingomonas sp. LK11]